MSTNDNNTANDGIITDSLDDFADELFGGSDSASGNAKPEDTQDDDVDNTDDSEEQELDTQDNDDNEDSDDLDDVSEDDDTLAPETNEDDEDSDDSEEEEDSSKPKKKKNRFQERIDELTAARKEAERKVEETRLEYEKRIARLEAKLEGNNDDNKESKNLSPNNENESGRPDPTAKDENGTLKYPLGEYDPQYMQDLMQHMLDQKEQEQKKQSQLSEQEQQKQAHFENLQKDWNTKLETARERYPDFQQKGEQMLTVFEGIDEQYGEYLTTTLMEMDHGPDVFYYLSNNIDEAQEIVSAGPKKATMALARLEAKLSDGGRKGKSKTKVSKAKSPPPTNKGAAVASPKNIEDILESGDLNAFERQLFRSK